MDIRYPDKMENAQKSGDTPEVIEIQTNSQNELNKDGKRRKTDNDVCVDTIINSKQSTTPTSDSEPASKPSSSANRQDSIPDVPTDQHSVPINGGSSSMLQPIQRIMHTQPSKIDLDLPPTTVVIIEKQPPTYVILSAVSFFINPLCGAMAIWQSCKF